MIQPFKLVHSTPKTKIISKLVEAGHTHTQTLCRSLDKLLCVVDGSVIICVSRRRATCISRILRGKIDLVLEKLLHNYKIVSVFEMPEMAIGCCCCL